MADEPERDHHEDGALHLEIDVEGLDTPTGERFSAAAESAATVFSGVVRNFGVELPELVVVGTLDFQSTVDELLHRLHGADEPAFTTERLGGTAVGKTVPLNDDRSKLEVVLAAEPWIEPAGPAGLGVGLYLLAHELTHCVLERMRVLSGALEGVSFPPATPRPAARSITRIAVDEMRADWVADLVLSLSATKTVEGEELPLHISDLGMLGPTLYRDRLAELLVTRVYPGWANTVNTYRTWGMTLEELMRQLMQETDQVMTTLAHAQGEALSTPENGDLFLPPASGEPGASWLVGPVWETVMTAVAAPGSLIPPLPEFKAAELSILDAGEDALFAMWEKLGVTFDPARPDAADAYQIKVGAPDEPPAAKGAESAET